MLVAWSHPENGYEGWEGKLSLLSCALSTGLQLCLLDAGCSSAIICIFLIKKKKETKKQKKTKKKTQNQNQINQPTSQKKKPQEGDQKAKKSVERIFSCVSEKWYQTPEVL